jgi:hypothetical protein
MAEMLMNRGYDPNVSGMPFGTGSPGEIAQQPAGLASLISGLYAGLGDTAKKAFGAAQLYTDTGQYDPSPVFNAAMLPMGTGAVAGVPLRGSEMALGAGPIRAYHGSPHDFDAFSLDKIGTGEGAQAYGHGLYFAESEPVAKYYRDALTQYAGQTKINTPYREGMLDDSPRSFERFFSSRFKENRGDLGKTIEHLQSDLQRNPKDGTITQALDFATNPDHKFTLTDPNPGKMYEVNINADPEHFLDWDKPLSEQSQHVREAYQNLKGTTDPKESAAKVRILQEQMDALTSDRDPVTNMMRNEQGWHRLARERDAAWEDWNAAQSGAKFYESMGRKAAAVPALQQAGIPGIKYLDQGSRGAGQGSSNYVVFNDKLIDILKKYGLAGAMASPAFGQVQNSPVFGSPKQDPTIGALLGGT